MLLAFVLSCSVILHSHGDTLVSVKETLSNHSYKDLSAATAAKWTPSDADTVAKEMIPYLKDAKWGSFKPFKEILQYRSLDYVLEELEFEVAGKRIPYFIAYHKNTPATSSSRALQVGLPAMVDYPPGDAVNVLAQKLWLDKGGVVIVTPLNIDDPFTLLSGADSDKQKLYQKFSDQFGLLARHLLETKKVGAIAMESTKDTLFVAVYTAVRYSDVYSRVILIQPEAITVVANPVTPPTPKTWPDYNVQDWYKNMLTGEYAAKKKAKSFRPVATLIAVDSQNTFAGKMAYGVLKAQGVPVDYVEVSLWSYKDQAEKTAKFQALKYNYLASMELHPLKPAPAPNKSKKKKSK